MPPFSEVAFKNTKNSILTVIFNLAARCSDERDLFLRFNKNEAWQLLMALIL
jgi:hypothetical protein